MGSILGREGGWRSDEDDKTEIRPKFPKLIQEDGGYGNEDIVEVIEEHSPVRGSKGNGRERGRDKGRNRINCNCHSSSD